MSCVMAVYSIPRECGKYTLSKTSRWFALPTANDVLTKSPKPSMAQQAAVSNGETKKALARCAGWCSTKWSFGRSSRGMPSAAASGPCRSRTLPAFRTRSSTRRGSGRCVRVNSPFRRRFAFGSRLTATWRTSAPPMPAMSSTLRMASVGKPAQCFTRRNRSSSTAATSWPSRTNAADTSP